MHAVVVFESIWGNTEQLAREVAAGLGGERTEVVDAASAPVALEADVDLLVVGGPTHAFSMSTSSTREAAKQQGAAQVPTRGIREWIEAVSSPARAVPVATFDTRVVTPRLPGSAAKKAMKRLVALGFRPLAKPETFGVHGYSGPVADGELDRARRWGAELAGLSAPALSPDA
ncbi:flavodoxin family protein [Microbacterium sp.]|uniref:flavodoxin family protein n=1 Tax=Microbacterium sp. TaxID=51671 RepID=UPI003C1A6ECD